MEILIAALLIGLLPAAIAKSKGYSFMGWWLFGAALFIVALPVAICMKSSHKGEKQCPVCAEWVKSEALVCRFCRHEFPAPDVEALKAAEEAWNSREGFVPYGTARRSLGH